MSQLSFSGGNKFSPEIWSKFVAAVRAMAGYDSDSGWIPTPADKVVKHNLAILPKAVFVYASDSANGEGFSTDTATSVTSAQVTITGPKPFCRVLANK